MADLSQIPTEQLMQLYQGGGQPSGPLRITVRPSDAGGSDLSQVSTEELLKAYNGNRPMSATGEPQRDNLINKRADELAPNAGASKFMQGLTFGFGDELGAGISSLVRGTKYDDELAAERLALQRFDQEHPVAGPVAEAGGALATIPFTPVARIAQGAGIASRAANAAVTGAGVGAAYGAGTSEGGIEDRLRAAVPGAGIGAATGAVGVPAIEAALGVSRVAARTFQPLRGAINPEAEAARRIGRAIEIDNPNTPNAIQQGGQTLAQANANGTPMVVADLGGDATRRLARSAANTSPEAQTALNQAVNNRFETQNDRLSDVVRGVVGGNPNATAARTALEDAARNANRPAYQRAYTRPNAQAMYDGVLDELMQSPAMQEAARSAWATGRNRAATASQQAPTQNPFVRDPQTGRVSLDQNRGIPNLEFWDHVKRNLDAMNSPEGRLLSQTLRGHLDGLVPEYAAARAGAARAFGANDALTAGQEFASSSMSINEARAAHARLNQAERALFAQGFASDLLEKIGKVGDRQNVINRVLGSADARDRINLALGPGGLQRIEAAARVENIMDRLRTALQGNSTTARQLADLAQQGLSGASHPIGAGAIGLATTAYTGDFKTGALVFAGLLARRGTAAIDARVAARIGEMLASNDPQVLRQAYNMIGRNRAILNAVRRVEGELPRGAQPALPSPQGIQQYPAAAEDQNN